MLFPRIGRAAGERPDAGLGLIEVVVAMVVFGVVATGIISAVTITLRMTPDSEAREVAANLAAQDIDQVRAIGDPYQVTARTQNQTINGRTYTVARKTGWLQPNGVAGSCGASTANFELKVNVDVHWTGQTSTTGDVRSDTLLAPLSSLTNGTTGALAINVQDANDGGAPVSGATLSVTPSSNANGATTPSSQPTATGTDGCSYLGKLTPGNYDVSASVGPLSGTDRTVAVAAGATTTAPTISLTGAGQLSPNLADNAVGSPLLPTDLTVSYLTGSSIKKNSAASSVTVSTGAYTAVAGQLGPVGSTATCNEFDPSQWAAGTSNGKQLANGTRDPSVTAPIGGTARIGVPMGTVQVHEVQGMWIRAVQVTPAGNGNPGCTSATTTLHFDEVTSNDADLALPYGTWQLFEGPLALAELIPVTALQIQGTSNAAGDGVDSSGIVTIDPRPLQ